MRSGNDTPAILIENSTAANRAVNIPEFVNMAPSGIAHIDTPAVDFYKQFDVAADLAKKGKYAAAIPEWIKALAMEPDDERAHNDFGQTLAKTGSATRPWPSSGLPLWRSPTTLRRTTILASRSPRWAYQRRRQPNSTRR